MEEGEEGGEGADESSTRYTESTTRPRCGATDCKQKRKEPNGHTAKCVQRQTEDTARRKGFNGFAREFESDAPDSDANDTEQRNSPVGHFFPPTNAVCTTTP